MYIGPWQEYRLSKQREASRRPVPRNASGMSEGLKQQLEQILQTSLDPTAAETAIKAVDSVLEKHARTEKMEKQLTLSLQQTVASQYRHVFPDESSVQGEDSLSLHLRNQQRQNGRNRTGNDLSLSLSARDRHSMAHQSPLSVRSTQSEPIQSLPSLLQVTAAAPTGSKSVSQVDRSGGRESFVSLNSHTLSMHQATAGQTATTGKPPLATKSSYPPQQQQQQQQFQQRQIENGYDAGALVNFLRMERNQRARIEISRLTGWTAISSVPSGQTSDASDFMPLPTKKDKLEMAKEKRLQQVNKMKELYMQNLTQAPYGSPRQQESMQTTTTTTTTTNGPLETPLASKYALVIPTGRVTGRDLSDSIPSTADSTFSSSAAHRAPARDPSYTKKSALSPIESPRVPNLEQLTDEELLIVSKYFVTNSTQQGASLMPTTTSSRDYESIPLQHASLQKNNSMDYPEFATQPSEENTVRENDRSRTISMSSAVYSTPSRSFASLPDRPAPPQEQQAVVEDSGEEERAGIAELVRVRSQLQATGSFADDFSLGHLDQLVEWTRGLSTDEVL